MSSRNLLLFLFLLPVLFACSGLPQIQPLASPDQIKQAASLSSYSDQSNIYISRPFTSPEYSYYTIYINGTKAGQLRGSQFINLKLSPGLYDFHIEENSPEYPNSPYFNDSVSIFDLELDAGSVVLLSCGQNGLSDWDEEDWFLLPSESCGDNTGLSTKSRHGIRSCSKKFEVKSDLEWHGVKYSRDTLKNCKLTPNKDIIYDQEMVVANTNQIVPIKIPESIVEESTEPSITEAEFNSLLVNSKCKLKNQHWAYTGESCLNGLADGEGSAKNAKGLSFVGTFSEGKRIKGEIFQDGNMVFAGNLIDDKPDGNAICFYEGEYEECRFYKGKRIDTLYKIRIENAKLKESQNSAKYTSTAQSNKTANKGITDHAVDALEKEALNQAASFIFDSLF